ncbi:MAG: ATP-binding protein [Pseudomonadota bacterium]
MMRHKRLLREVRRALGVSSERALQDLLAGVRERGDGALADGLALLLEATERSYEQYDRDLQVRTRMLEISSEELLSANAQLRAEAARQREVLLSLQASVQRLTFDASGATPERRSSAQDEAARDPETDLLGLTHALEQLVQQRETARELTEQILDQLPIPVFLKDREGRFVRFNRQFEKFSKRARDAMLGHKIEEFASPRWSAITHQEDALAWHSGRMVTSERRLTNMDPPMDMLVNRIVITSGGESYLLGFSIDVSEQRAARDAMQRAVEQAQAASRAKSEFLANMSHEIRTPMNGILGMTELVLESRLEPEQRDDIALVKASADSLLTIVNDILDFSKIEAGKLDLEEVPFDLRKLVREAVRSMALRAQQKGLVLRAEVEARLPRTVKGDPGRLRQVLLNLLANAIKFTETGSVVLALTLGDDTDEHCNVTFAVRDTGIGIALDKQTLIFEAFSQVDGSTTRQFGGTGLGLTICRRLVILMQGDLTVESEAGKGSVFSFTVPLRHAPVQLPATLDPPEPPDQLSLLQPASASEMAAPVLPQGAPQGSGLHILLAEDNPVNQRLALRLLEKMGHRISVAGNGIDALERATQGGIDLILMDVQMPELDGLSATRRIRQWEAEHGGHLPIIAMTARAMAGDRERCLEAGMDDYLSKPIDSERLRQLVSRFHVEQAGPVLSWRSAMLRLDGDAALFLELGAMFLDDGPLLLDTLYEALDAGDLPASQRAVHSLQGVLVNFGAQRAIAQTERLTASLHEPAQASQWRVQAAELGAAVDEVYLALRALIKAGPGAMV